MSALITEPNIRDFDAVYERLIALHAGLDAADSHRVNCRLILVLLNHIGDERVIAEAFDLVAKRALTEKGSA